FGRAHVGQGQEAFVYAYNQLVDRFGQPAADLMIGHRVHPYRLHEALIQIDVDRELWCEATGQRVGRISGLEAWLWDQHDRARYGPTRCVPERPQNERPDEEISCRQGEDPVSARQFLSQQVEREGALEANEDQTFDEFCQCETHWLFFEFCVVRERVRVAHDADASADSNIADGLAWLWRFQKQNTRAERSTRLGCIRVLTLKDGRRKQCLIGWPGSDARSISPVGYVLPRRHPKPSRITGPRSKRWRQDGADFISMLVAPWRIRPRVGEGITITEWYDLRGARLPRRGIKFPLWLITQQATRRDNAVDRKRRVFYGYHYLAGQERQWAARAPAHGHLVVRRPYRRDIPVARDHNTKPVPTDKSRKPAAPVGCVYRWLDGWGWGLFDKRAPTILAWRSDGNDIAAHVLECKRRREAAIDGLLSNFGG